MVAAAVIGSSVIGGVASIASGDAAADAQRDAAASSAATQKYIYDTTRADYAPYRAIGTSALRRLAAGYGISDSATGTAATGPDYSAFYKSPDYTFRQQEGEKALNRAAAAGGKWNSPALTKKLMGFNDNLAASGYDAYANRLASLAGVGQSATGTVAQAGQNYASGVTAANTAAGNATASAYENTGSAINNGLSGIAGYFAYKDMAKVPWNKGLPGTTV